MSVSDEKKSMAQKALWRDPDYRAKMMEHYEFQKNILRNKGHPQSLKKKAETKQKSEPLELQDSGKSRGNTEFLKGYPTLV